MSGQEAITSETVLSGFRITIKESLDRNQPVIITAHALLALVECAEALKWMHPREGVWLTPNDAQVSFAEAALRKLEAIK